MITDKVRPHHLERKALLYVRQSSAHQVLHNRESSALQYAMRDRLTALGWSEIEVIDDDLGRSAAGGVQRAGFERMVAEVCLGKVGAVCAREVSRFARNCPCTRSGHCRRSSGPSGLRPWRRSSTNCNASRRS
jgi:DNA invertase Pin-like site-specific DNA recombinase